MIDTEEDFEESPCEDQKGIHFCQMIAQVFPSQRILMERIKFLHSDAKLQRRRRKEAVAHLLEISGFDGVFDRDLDVVLLHCHLVNHGEGVLEVRRWRDPDGSKDGGGSWWWQKDASGCEGGQTVACNVHR
ncbi:hypothetical protein SESBI_40538 [Sesbania bispinosa]|nr:hypothetical protein SESBI_40538 [Sesbania bispinosa]